VLPGFTATSSLHRSRRTYAGHDLSFAAQFARTPKPADVASRMHLQLAPLEPGPGRGTLPPVNCIPWPLWFRCPAETTSCVSASRDFPIHYCVYTQTDPNNCGECGNVCAPGQSCQNGVCGVSCCSANRYRGTPADTDGVPCCQGADVYCCPSGYTPSTTNACQCSSPGQPNQLMGCCASCPA
jgi:hypothetical protein